MECASSHMKGHTRGFTSPQVLAPVGVLGMTPPPPQLPRADYTSFSCDMGWFTCMQRSSLEVRSHLTPLSEFGILHDLSTQTYFFQAPLQVFYFSAVSL